MARKPTNPTQLQRIKRWRRDRAEWPSIVLRAQQGDEEAQRIVEEHVRKTDPLRPNDKPSDHREGHGE